MSGTPELLLAEGCHRGKEVLLGTKRILKPVVQIQRTLSVDNEVCLLSVQGYTLGALEDRDRAGADRDLHVAF